METESIAKAFGVTKYPKITIEFLPDRLDIKIENDTGLTASQLDRALRTVPQTLQRERMQRRHIATRAETQKTLNEAVKKDKEEQEQAKAAILAEAEKKREHDESMINYMK